VANGCRETGSREAAESVQGENGEPKAESRQG
jgi:hypothetical protein